MVNRWRCQEIFCSQAQYSLICRYFNVQNILRKTTSFGHSADSTIRSRKSFLPYDPSGGWHSPQILDHLRRIVILGCHSTRNFQAINTQTQNWIPPNCIATTKNGIIWPRLSNWYVGRIQRHHLAIRQSRIKSQTDQGHWSPCSTDANCFSWGGDIVTWCKYFRSHLSNINIPLIYKDFGITAWSGNHTPAVAFERIRSIGDSVHQSKINVISSDLLLPDISRVELKLCHCQSCNRYGTRYQFDPNHNNIKETVQKGRSRLVALFISNCVNKASHLSNCLRRV